MRSSTSESHKQVEFKVQLQSEVQMDSRGAQGVFCSVYHRTCSTNRCVCVQPDVGRHPDITNLETNRDKEGDKTCKQMRHVGSRLLLGTKVTPTMANTGSHLGK